MQVLHWAFLQINGQVLPFYHFKHSLGLILTLPHLGLYLESFRALLYVRCFQQQMRATEGREVGGLCDSWDWDQPEEPRTKEPRNSSQGSELTFLICSKQKLNTHTRRATVHSVQEKDLKDMIFRMKTIGDRRTRWRSFYLPFNRVLEGVVWVRSFVSCVFMRTFSGVPPQNHHATADSEDNRSPPRVQLFILQGGGKPSVGRWTLVSGYQGIRWEVTRESGRGAEVGGAEDTTGWKDSHSWTQRC